MTPDLRKRGHKKPVVGPWKPCVHRADEHACPCCRKVDGAWRACDIWHRTEGAAKRHCEQLNRKEARAK